MEEIENNLFYLASNFLIMSFILCSVLCPHNSFRKVFENILEEKYNFFKTYKMLLTLQIFSYFIKISRLNLTQFRSNWHESYLICQLLHHRIITISFSFSGICVFLKKCILFLVVTGRLPVYLTLFEEFELQTLYKQ